MQVMIKREAQSFFSALQFLTRLPTPKWTGWEEGRLDRAAPYFTLAGVIIGALCGLAYITLIPLTTPTISALFALGLGVLLTGGLHEDGLADFADGAGGGRDRTHALEIMKDSRMGSYGVLALIFCITLKLLTLSALAPMTALVALIAAHGLSRASLFLTVKWLGYARPENEGKIAPISRVATPGAWVRLALMSFIAIAPLIGLASAQGQIGTVITALALAVVTTLWIVLHMRRALGGWTGDALGAQQQVFEAAFLLGVSGWIYI